MRGHVPIAEIADWLHPAPVRFKAMALLKAYFDESGTHAESPVTAIAGFVGTKDAWRSVEADMLAALKLFEDKGVRDTVAYLPRLLKEHGYWMAGAEELRPGEARRHCVRLEDGALLNRYWDDRDSPREESHR